MVFARRFLSAAFRLQPALKKKYIPALLKRQCLCRTGRTFPSEYMAGFVFVICSRLCLCMVAGFVFARYLYFFPSRR